MKTSYLALALAAAVAMSASIAVAKPVTDADFSAAVVKEGYTNVQIGGFAYGACGDTYARHFTAIDKSGQTVKGYVCAAATGPFVRLPKN